jgi:hypothetical protein
MKTFIYLSRLNRAIFKGLVKTGKFTNLSELRLHIAQDITNYHN